MNQDQQRFSEFTTGFPGQPAGIAGRILGIVGAVLAAALAFMFSLVALAVIATAAAVLGGWLWWKTRAVRQQMHDRMQQRPADGYIIEGEVIREAETMPTLRRLPE